MHWYHYSEEFHQRKREFFKVDQTNGTPGLLQAILDDPCFSPALHQVQSRRQLHNLLAENSDVFQENWKLQQRLEPTVSERLDEIYAPTLVLGGDRDDADNQAIVDWLATKINNSKKVIVPDAGHLIHLEIPEQFNQIVLDFLQEQAI